MKKVKFDPKEQQKCEKVKMGPKVQRTPLKKEAQEEEDLENLHFLRKDQQDVLDQLKVKIDATLVEERTEAAAKVHRWRLDTCFTAFAAIKERIYRADPEKRTEHKMVAVEFEALFDQLAMALGGWNVGAVQPASSALAERNDHRDSTTPPTDYPIFRR